MWCDEQVKLQGAQTIPGIFVVSVDDKWVIDADS
jgi:hypothetical protein